MTFKKEAAMTMSDELGKLEELRQRGVLTEEEFARAKARVLGESPRPAGPPGVAAINALRRSRGDRWLAGVCGGLARSTGMDSWVWRLLFTVLALLGGAGCVALHPALGVCPERVSSAGWPVVASWYSPLPTACQVASAARLPAVILIPLAGGLDRRAGSRRRMARSGGWELFIHCSGLAPHAELWTC